MKFISYNKFLKFLFAIVLTSVLMAALSLQALPPTPLYFDHYNDRYGLSSNSVSAILQDREGYIWVATRDGLNRFDGFRFRRIDTGEGESCSWVSTLYEDSDGKIWIGAHNGAFIYDPSTEHMEKFLINKKDGRPITQPVIQFLDDTKGNILIVVDSEGVYRYDRQGNPLQPLFLSKNIKVNKAIYDVHGRIWVGTFGQGLFYSDNDMATLRQFSGEPADCFTNAIVSDLKIRGDRLYVATERFGLHTIDLNTKVVANIFGDHQNGRIPYIRQILFDGQGNLMIASEAGLYLYDMQKGEIASHISHNIFDKYSLSDNAIYTLMCDREGGIWVGSYFGGLDYADRRRMRFNKYYPDNSPGSLNGQRIRELCEDNATGKIFVGSEDHGLSCFNPADGTFEPVEGISSNNVHALLLDHGKLWVGTFAQGLKVKDLNTGVVREYGKADGMTNDYVFAIKRTLGGETLVGTMRGLLVYNPSSDSFSQVDEFSNIFIFDILEDKQGNLWVATYDHGLYLRPSGHTTWKNYRWDAEKPDGLPGDKIYGLYEDTEGILWIMTQDGPCAYNPLNSSFDRKHLGVDRIQGVVYQVIDDDCDHLWLTTNHGLYSLDRKNNNLRRFSTVGGLPTNQFNYRSSLKVADGRIYLGTIEGLVSFQPLGVDFHSKKMTPVLAELYLHGELIRPDQEGSPLVTGVSRTNVLNLKSNQNSIAFRVVSLQYSSLQEQQIRYKLEGFDKDWHYAPLNESLLSYPNLNSGAYTLKVASYNEFDDADNDMIELKINVATPFYLRWWAMLIYVLLAAVIIYVILYQYRRNAQLNSQRYLENFKVEKEREAYDSKITFFTNVAHEIRTPLTLIKAPLDCMSKLPTIVENEEAKDNLDVINLNVDRLLLLANQLLDFRKMEDGKFQIHKQQADISEVINKCVTRFRPTVEMSGKTLEVNLPDEPVMAYVDSEAITKIISNLITNAIKYGDKEIILSLENNESEVIVTISNDGDTVPDNKREEIFTLFSRLVSNTKSPGTGLGLPYARSLAQMHGGTLKMTDNQKLNEFKLVIPIVAPPHIEEERDADAGVRDIEQMINENAGATTILVADDNLEMLKFLEKKLIEAGYKVIKATDGKDAIDLLHNEYVDIVVSDVMMPEVDGIELLQHIKSDISSSHIPVILLTAKTRMEDKLQGLDSGADAYIEKPFTMEYLLANITMLLRNRENIRKRLERMPYKNASGKSLNKVDEEFLSKINKIIQENFNNSEFSMEDVISCMGMSRTSFYRKIKGMLDLNPNEYIRIERLKQAARMFDEGHTSVSEVCYLVGFSSPGYFTKCFQKQFGISPKEYISKSAKKTGLSE